MASKLINAYIYHSSTGTVHKIAHNDEICSEPICRVTKYMVYVTLPDMQYVSALCV